MALLQLSRDAILVGIVGGEEEEVELGDETGEVQKVSDTAVLPTAAPATGPTSRRILRFEDVRKIFNYCRNLLVYNCPWSLFESRNETDKRRGAKARALREGGNNRTPGGGQTRLSI